MMTAYAIELVSRQCILITKININISLHSFPKSVMTNMVRINAEVIIHSSNSPKAR